MAERLNASIVGQGDIVNVIGRGCIFGASDVVPTDTTSGFSKGCLYLQLDGADANTMLYLNSGTRASSTFVAFLGAALTGITAGTVTASKAMVVDANKRIFGLVGLEIGLGTTQIAIANGDGTTALTPELQIQGTTKATSSMLLSCNSATATSAVAPSINFLKSAHATIGSNTVVASGEVVGEIVWSGADGTDFKSSLCRIQGIVDTTPGTGDMPGRLVFSTSVDNAETLTESFRIDNVQRLIMGGAAAQAIANGDGSTALTCKQQILGTTKATGSQLIASFSATATSAAAPVLAFLKSANATIGSNTVVASGEVIGEILFNAADGTDFNSSACRIQAIVDTTPGAGDMPGRLVFSTSIDGGEVLTESFRIDNAQRLIMGGAAAQTISDGDGTTAAIPSHQILGTNKATSSLLLGNFSATSTSVAAPSLNFLKSANATIGSNTVVVSGGVLGEINFFGADGTDFKSPACRIAALVDTTPGTGDMPGRLVFSTSVDGGETLTTAMTISNAQTVTIAKGLIVNSNQAGAITTTRVLTSADSGGQFSVAKTSSYAITLPTAAQGLNFKFLALDAGAFAVTISDGAAHLFGVADIAGTPVVMTGTTLTLVATGGVGDWVEFTGIDSTHYHVTGACVTAAKITVA